MPKGFAFVVFASLLALLFGCGGAGQGATAQEGSSVGSTLEGGAASGPPPTFSRVDLTTAVDEKRMVATAPASTEFLPDTPRIFLIGTLDDPPEGAEIEVHWFKAAESEPLYVSRDRVSSNYTVLSRFRPPGDSFLTGEYRVLVYVGGREATSINFRVSDRRSGGRLRVKELAVSESVEVQTKKAINAATSFRQGVSKVFAGFFVGGLEAGATIRVLWYHNDELVREDDLESEGEKRYVQVFENAKGLAQGDWAVEVEVEREMFARRTFFVGGGNIGPVIDRVALGASLGKNGMPKKETTVFNRNARVIHCGMRILDLPDGSSVEVEWVSLKEGDEEVVHSTETKIENGGTTTVSSAWEPGGKLSAGSYMVVISLNGRKMTELPFTVK
jgi:hypothetical protein